jgi:hypothetical protein
MYFRPLPIIIHSSSQVFLKFIWSSNWEVYLKRCFLRNSISLISAGTPQLEKSLFSKLVDKDIASQSQSVLFNRIPGEIRQRIFEYACTSTDIRDEPVPHVALYHRPGYEHYQRVWTDLLRTCRRVYLETYLLPASVNEHVFWCYDGPPQPESQPYNFESPHNYMDYSLRLKLRTQEQKNAVQELHLFTQQFWLDMAGYGIGTRGGETAWMLAASSLAAECRPRKIKITIRHRSVQASVYHAPIFSSLTVVGIGGAGTSLFRAMKSSGFIPFGGLVPCVRIWINARKMRR